MARERRGHQVEGGCCALVVVYLLGKVYVANAGDSRYGVCGRGLKMPTRGHTLWDVGIENRQVVGVKNKKRGRDGLRSSHGHKEGLEVATRGGKMGVWVWNPKGYYGESLVFLEFSTRGLRRAKPKPFLSLGRAIIVRNGEIIPMSREFTPETERQRLQLLVSRS